MHVFNLASNCHRLTVFTSKYMFLILGNLGELVTLSSLLFNKSLKIPNCFHIILNNCGHGNCLCYINNFFQWLALSKHTKVNCFQVICGSSWQIMMLTHTLRYISWMYQQWDSRCGHSDSDFSPFSIAGIVKMRLGRPCNPKFALLASLFAIKTNMRVRNNLFWHVYGNTSCSTVVDDVTQTIFVTIFIGYDLQLCCILGLSLTSLRLLLKNKVFVTNSSRFPNLHQNTYILR